MDKGTEEAREMTDGGGRYMVTASSYPPVSETLARGRRQLRADIVTNMPVKWVADDGGGSGFADRAEAEAVAAGLARRETRCTFAAEPFSTVDRRYDRTADDEPDPGLDPEGFRRWRRAAAARERRMEERRAMAGSDGKYGGFPLLDAVPAGAVDRKAAARLLDVSEQTVRKHTLTDFREAVIGRIVVNRNGMCLPVFDRDRILAIDVRRRREAARAHAEAGRRPKTYAPGRRPGRPRTREKNQITKKDTMDMETNETQKWDAAGPYSAAGC